MLPSLKNRSLLSLQELSADEILGLLELAALLKRAKADGTEQARLRGRNIALLFDKTGPRTRGALEVAAHDQGAHVSFVGPGDSRLGEKESIKDTARVLGRLYDAIEYRGFDQNTAQALAKWSGIPVYNDLTSPFHPTQILADFLTMHEHCTRPLAQIRLACLGDPRYGVGASLLQGAALLGMDCRIAAPHAMWPPQALIEATCELARSSGARLSFTESAHEAVQRVDFVYTDAPVSMGEPDAQWPERIAQLEPYQVNASLLEASGNARVKFLHGLPALHDRRASQGLEVTDEVLESPASLVREQAENRLHTVKALLVATLD